MSYLHKKSILDIDVTGKRVIMRVDFNVPHKNSVIQDDTRIRAALPSIQYLLEHKAAVILMSHLGRPKGKPNRLYTLRPVAERLSELLNHPVTFIPECVGQLVNQAVAEMRPGDVILLENLRFHPEEERNTPPFSAALASLADIYVNDAFGTAHRAHSSTVGITAYLPSVAGFLIDKELHQLGKLISDPEHPFVAIVGGAKISDKIHVIENLVAKVDRLLIGGGMANTFLAAAGHEMQGSLVEWESIDVAKTFLASPLAQERLVLPVDLVAAEKFAADASFRAVEVDAIPTDWTALDIGPRTSQRYGEEIAQANTIFWNGPMGVFEMDNFAQGTLAVAHYIAASHAFSVIGGGDSISAVNKAGVADRISHICTGGGAALEFLEGKILPGVAALDDKE